jgi:hypothetical protein
MARGLDSRFEKLPHARLRHSPHQCHGASLTFEEASGRGCKAARPFLFRRKKAHKAQNQLTMIQVSYFVTYVPFCG